MIIMLAALSHFTSRCRALVVKWCGRQPQGTMCSLNTVFDLVCEDQRAQVPDQYYETLGLGDLDNSVSDLVILSCSEIAGLYRRTDIQVRSKVDLWLDANTVTTGAQSVRSDTPPRQRVRVAHTAVRRRDSAPPQSSCKWILSEGPSASGHIEDAGGGGHVASGSDAPSTSTSAESSSQTPQRSLGHYNSVNLEALDPYPEDTPYEEPLVKQGFWPEVGEAVDSGGCPCWRCFHGCRI